MINVPGGSMTLPEPFSASLANLVGEIGTDIKKYKGNIAEVIDQRLNVRQAFEANSVALTNWCNNVNFRDLGHVQKLHEVYIQLETYLYPRAISNRPGEPIPRRSLIELLQTDQKHVFILGQPGSGKTTSMKFLCKSLLESPAERLAGRIPLLILVRELESEDLGAERRFSSNTLLEAVVSALGIRDLNSIIQRLVGKQAFPSIGAEQGPVKKERLSEQVRRLVRYLDRSCSFLIIEGLDEAPNEEMRISLMMDVRTLARYLSSCRIIVTLRTGENVIVVENSDVYEIAPLDQVQVREFVSKWFPSGNDSAKLLAQIDRSPYADTTIKPLTLAHLCAIYERSRTIPEKPRTVYKKIISLLLDEWDQQRGIRRETKYSGFEIDRKIDFLSNVAYSLTLETRRNVFTSQELGLVYTKICEDYALPHGERVKVVEEIESHTGLLLKSGYDAFEFSHKSLQEYLAADYISRLPDLEHFPPHAFPLMPNELAIAITLSSNQSLYFSTLVLKYIQKFVKTTTFFPRFLDRLFQEKPDFNASQEVVTSFLLLYTKYMAIENGLEGGQLTLIPFDDNVRAFERIYEKLSTRNQFGKILDDYRIVSDFDTQEDSILTLSPKRPDSKLPSMLLARESFFRAN